MTDGGSQTLSLEQLASKVAGTFEVAFFELETIRDTSREFDRQVERLLEATEPGASDEAGQSSYSSFFAHTGRAAEAAQEAAQSLADKKFQTALISVTTTLQEIDRCAVELQSVSFLTKTTLAETSAGTEQVSVFVETLDTQLKELQRSSKASSKLISAIQQRSGLARAELATIASEFRSILRQGESRQDNLASLKTAHEAHIEHIKTAAADLRSGVGQAVGRLVGCLQFPDAFRQRVEHLDAALDSGGDAEEAGALAAVVSAQLDALARDLDRETGGAVDALNALSSTLSGDTALGSDAGFDASNAWVDANRRTNDGMLNAVASGRAKLDNTVELLGDLVERIDRAQENLKTASNLNGALETSVFNALIVASKLANTDTPLPFLAGHVRAVVERSSGLIEQISVALKRIRRTSKALERTGLEADLEQLAAIQESLSERSTGIARMVKQIATAREALQSQSMRLSTSSGAAIQAFQIAADYAPAFGDLARTVRAAAEAGDGPYRDVPWLYASYTMEVERDVHRGALGLPEAEAEDGEDADDFDDFLL
ncbi:hypothetical protein [uncultured Jannaschia sp.]|uniref:hypothetical protein n=1 Tax=uncultured Jannaschia sp. TaxID=293347 RepID=UPI0026378FC9|nr:hypothetical protein [uncultured Jannaschia sp.]